MSPGREANLLRLAGLVCGLLLALPAVAQEQRIGQIKVATGAAAIERDGARRPASAGDPVFARDVLRTGADGTLGLTFIDNTTFATGPNSVVALEEFSFDSANFKGAMTANVRQGTLVVTSGDIARASPGAMQVRTPGALIGVRGTSFAIQVAP